MPLPDEERLELCQHIVEQGTEVDGLTTDDIENAKNGILPEGWDD